jgi:hypothetical protein
MKCLAKKGSINLYEDESGLFWFETSLDLDKTNLSWEGEQELEKSGKVRPLAFGFHAIDGTFADQAAFAEIKCLLEPALIRLWMEDRLNLSRVVG